jgi:hypothetical protein
MSKNAEFHADFELIFQQKNSYSNSKVILVLFQTLKQNAQKTVQKIKKRIL